MASPTYSKGLQGLNPLLIRSLNVAAEAATYNDCFQDGSMPLPELKRLANAE